MNDWLQPRYMAWIANGFALTLLLSVSTIVASTVAGFGLAMARLSQRAVIAHGAALYVVVFRNSPLLVQLLFWYFGAATLLPSSLMNWLNAPHILTVDGLALSWPSFEIIAGWVGLTCYSTTFVGEELRAGIRGVPANQHHAAAALGLTPWLAFLYVILPQAIRIAMPSLAGQYMNIVKNSSLTMAIGVAELSYMSHQVDTETFKSFQAFGAATVLYIVTIAVIEAALMIWQRRDARTMGPRRT
ncbi:amino acid ABC transporter permease [Paraburkholderia rhizosphaerae]|uniref:Amino acid ABC transporter membrane protein 1 (PAAT family) n=1 Tax=Paraburkholderia rhizosphaerae TaxID=480658 RepID=A0A4R8LVY2_9BURK|nr:amino acid ABC transporter permease [Paraburkholderia rhizosphaerae]TDY51005.1 amino acid ABC transporter membrane protein 1 (PAAT family) [Paraburkholderia rhizosphaerae]